MGWNNARPLTPVTSRVRAAADKILRDPARITKYVNNLGATYEERIFAVNELRRAAVEGGLSLEDNNTSIP